MSHDSRFLSEVREQEEPYTTFACRKLCLIRVGCSGQHRNFTEMLISGRSSEAKVKKFIGPFSNQLLELLQLILKNLVRLFKF